MIKNLQSADESTWLESKGITLLTFWAPWCDSCKRLMPTLDMLDGLGIKDFTILKCNSDELQTLAAEYEITALPSSFIYKDGMLVRNVLGNHPLRHLVAIIEEVRI